MVMIPQASVEEQILCAMEEGVVPQEKRPYMGYSGLGGKCKRKVWYDFRWVKDRSIDRRIDRLFKRGDWEEPRIIKDLEHAGIKFHSEQLEVVGLAKHVKGHIDGLLDNLPNYASETFLAEFKTANDKFFKQFKKNGCRATNQTYYYQAQAYMGELGLKYCLFIVTNKNDEKRYIEIIEFDEGEFNYLQGIALEILTTDVPPDKIGGVTWFDCKFCDYYDVCHQNRKPNKNCRTCEKGVVEEDGIWSCNSEFNLTDKDQLAGCVKQDLLKDLR